GAVYFQQLEGATEGGRVITQHGEIFFGQLGLLAGASHQHQGQQQAPQERMAFHQGSSRTGMTVICNWPVSITRTRVVPPAVTGISTVALPTGPDNASWRWPGGRDRRATWALAGRVSQLRRSARSDTRL